MTTRKLVQQECPHCSEEFSTERGKNIHVGRMHKQKKQKSNVCENVKQEVSDFRDDANKEGASEDEQQISNVSQSSYGSADKENEEGEENGSNDKDTYELNDGEADEGREDDAQSTEKTTSSTNVEGEQGILESLFGFQSCSLPNKESYHEGAEDITRSLAAVNLDDNREVAEILEKDDLNEGNMTRVWEKLTKPVVLTGIQSYKLWKLVLKYMVDNDYEIYIVNPFFDAERLKYILELFTEKSKQKNCKLIATRKKNSNDVDISTIANDAKSKISPEKLPLVAQVMQALQISKKGEYFHCKFLAGFDQQMVHVIMTSANFNKNHFDPYGPSKTGNLDSWLYSIITWEDFKKKLLLPLQQQLEIAGLQIQKSSPVSTMKGCTVFKTGQSFP